MNKKIFSLLLVVLALLSISAISAADVIDNNQTLALDSSSDISAVSSGDADVLAISNNDEIQQTSDSDDVLGGDSRYPTKIAFIANNPRENEPFTIGYNIWSPDEEDDDDEMSDDEDFEVTLELDDYILTSYPSAYEGVDVVRYKGYFYNIVLPNPGFHFSNRITCWGSDDYKPSTWTDDNFYVLPQEGSKIIFTDFLPGMEDGVINFDYGEEIFLNFRAVSEKTNAGLSYVEFNGEFDQNLFRVITGGDGEISFKIDGTLAAGSHTLKFLNVQSEFEPYFTETTITINVNRLPVYMDVDTEDLDLDVGETAKVDADLYPPEAGSPTFTPSNTNVVTVDSNGNVNAVGEGKATITVSYAGTEKYAAVESVIIPVNVFKIETSIDVEEDSLELDVGDEDRLVANLDPPEAGKLTYVSSNESVVTVDDKGNYKAVGEGKATITVSFAGDYKYAAAEDVVVEVNVSKIETDITVEEESLELNVGDEGSIEAELEPVEAGRVTHVSSDESVVTVDSNGNYKAVGEGEATITVRFDGDYNKYTLSEVVVTVSVSKIETSIAVEDDSLELDVDEEGNIGAELNPVEAGKLTYVSSNESVVAVDENGNFKAVGEGKATITVSFDGDYNKYALSDAVVTVSVSKIETSIDVEEESLEFFVGDSDAIVAELTPIGAGRVNFTSSNVSVVTVDKKGILKSVGEGEATITVSYEGNYKYSSSEATVTVKVSKIGTSIDLHSDDNLNLFVGEEDTIVAELNPPKVGRITYTSSDDSVVTVDSNGNLAAVGEGEANITLSFRGNSRCVAADNVTIKVSVSKIDTSISVYKDSFNLYVGDEDSIDAELSPNEAGDITFTSSDESVVTVDANGNLVAVGEGEAEITVSFAGNNMFNPSETVVNVNVSKKSVRIELMSNDTLELNVGDEDKIIAYIIIDDGSEMIPFDLFNSLEYNVTSDDDDDDDDSADDIVEVDDEGNVKAVGEGEATIVISFSGNDMYEAADDVEVSVTVSMIETSIKINSANSLKLFVGNEDIIDAELNPDDAGDITFTSSDESVVTVDEEGNIVAVGEGEAEITLSFDGDERYEAAEDAVATVTVSKIDTSITINSEKSLELFVGDGVSVVAELNPVEAGNVTFTSSDESVVTVGDDGSVVAVGEGEATITLSYDGNYKYNAADDVTVTVSVSKIDTNISVDEDSLDLFVGDEDSIAAELNPADAGNVTFVSSDESVVTVGDDGSVVAVGEGEANITVSFDGDDKYVASEAIVTVTVSKIDTSISVVDDELELNVHDEDSIAAELNPADAGNVTFVSSDESVVTVGDDGSVVAVGEGEANITVSFDGDDRYVASEAVITVTVSKIDTIISVRDNSLDMIVGDEDIIIADFDPEEAGNLTFTSSDESVVTVDGEGNIEAINEGEAIITVSFAGDDKYAASEAIVYVTVSMINTRIDIRSDDSLDMFVGDEDNITAFVVADYGSGMIPVIHLKSLEYSSSDESVVTVDEDGNVKAVGEGEAVITVSFDGDGRYAAAEDVIIPVAVSLRDTSIDAKPKSLDLYVGEDDKIYYFAIPEDLDIKLNSSDESVATVEIVDDYVVVTAVGEGEANITFTVGDDTEYVLNSVTVYVTVSKIPTEIIVDDSLTLNVGDVTIIDLTTDPEDLDVTYESSDPSVVIVDEHGIITAVSNGTAIITIEIEEDDMYEASEATIIVTVNLEPAKEELNITADADDIIVGEDAIIEILGLGNATGNITLTIGGINYTLIISDGKAIFDIPDLDVGNYTIPVYYSGDDYYAPVNIYVNLNVGEKKPDVITADNVTKYYGDSERFVVIVTDYKGNPVAGKNVSFLINGVSYTRTTNAKGSASIPLNLISGHYNITVTVDNKNFTSEVNILPTVNGSDVVKVFRNGTHYFATFRDREGYYLKEGTAVRFNINGVMYDRKISGNEGLAKLNINLEQGEYIITAMNTVTGENAANKITVIPKLIENRDITKYYRNETQYTVKVIGDDGKAVGAGEIVKFNINGVFYTRSTNESGIVKLNLNLQPGDYILTAEYGNCKVSNNVKIISVLFASDMSMKYRDGSKFTAKLVDGEGRSYAGQTVQFNINGVMYNRVTDSSGQAKLNINLMAGEYIITSSYNGSNIANTIAITA